MKRYLFVILLAFTSRAIAQTPYITEKIAIISEILSNTNKLIADDSGEAKVVNNFLTNATFLSINIFINDPFNSKLKFDFDSAKSLNNSLYNTPQI